MKGFFVPVEINISEVSSFISSFSNLNIFAYFTSNVIFKRISVNVKKVLKMNKDNKNFDFYVLSLKMFLGSLRGFPRRI